MGEPLSGSPVGRYFLFDILQGIVSFLAGANLHNVFYVINEDLDKCLQKEYNTHDEQRRSSEVFFCLCECLCSFFILAISTEIENLTHPVQLREDEYLSENGMICCSKCRTPRQKRIEVAGRTMEPRCLCKCQQAEQEKREQERKHREFLDMVARNRSVGLPDPELRRHTFENDLG